MPLIFDVIATENARYKRNELELPFTVAMTAQWENGTVEWCCTGLSIDLLVIMSQEMEFDFNLYEVPDKVCGIRNEVRGGIRLQLVWGPW